MHSKSYNIEIMINDKVEDVIEEIFQVLLSRYQTGLETSTKDSDFIFDCIHLLYYKCRKINTNRARSYIDSLDWIKKQQSKKMIINAFNVLEHLH